MISCSGGTESIRHVTGSVEIRLATYSPFRDSHRVDTFIDTSVIENAPEDLITAIHQYEC